MSLKFSKGLASVGPSVCWDKCTVISEETWEGVETPWASVVTFPPGPSLSLCPRRCECYPVPKRGREVGRNHLARLSQSKEAGHRPMLSMSEETQCLQYLVKASYHGRVFSEWAGGGQRYCGPDMWKQLRQPFQRPCLNGPPQTGNACKCASDSNRGQLVLTQLWGLQAHHTVRPCSYSIFLR